MKFLKRHYLDKAGLPLPDSGYKNALAAVYWLLIISGIFTLQTNLTPFGIAFNFAVLVPFYTGLRKSPERGLFMGIVIGLIEDGLSRSILGPHILSKGMVGFLSPLLAGRFFVWTPLFGSIALFVVTFLDGLIVYACKGIFLAPPALFKIAVLYIFIQSIVNAPIGYFIRPRHE